MLETNATILFSRPWNVLEHLFPIFSELAYLLGGEDQSDGDEERDQCNADTRSQSVPSFFIRLPLNRKGMGLPDLDKT